MVLFKTPNELIFKGTQRICFLKYIFLMNLRLASKKKEHNYLLFIKFLRIHATTTFIYWSYKVI